jgi:hypothetical protein
MDETTLQTIRSRLNPIEVKINVPWEFSWNPEKGPYEVELAWNRHTDILNLPDRFLRTFRTDPGYPKSESARDGHEVSPMSNSARTAKTP